MNLPHLDTIDINNKRIFIRADLNVPFDDQGNISDETRILATLPLLKNAISKNAKIMLTSHRGRPKEGQPNVAESLAPIAQSLAKHLNQEVKLVKNWLDETVKVEVGQLVVLENCRFNQGEKSCDDELSKKMGAMCDVFINEAFATAHRKEATTYGIAQYAPIAVAGPLMHQELTSLSQALSNPEKPMIAIVAGSKVSTKLSVLSSLSEKVDQLIVGGGITNTFLLAQGYKVGKSLCEVDLIDEAKNILTKIQSQGGDIPLPEDVVVAKKFSKDAPARVCKVDEVEEDDLILDIGPKSAQKLAELLLQAKTIVWNGPVGVFEFEAFRNGTKVIADAIAHSSAFSIAGGGDTVAAVNLFNIADKINYISTAGGAFLEYLEGKTLPAIDILEKRGKNLVK